MKIIVSSCPNVRCLGNYMVLDSVDVLYFSLSKYFSLSFKTYALFSHSSFNRYSFADIAIGGPNPDWEQRRSYFRLSYVTPPLNWLGSRILLKDSYIFSLQADGWSPAPEAFASQASGILFRFFLFIYPWFVFFISIPASYCLDFLNFCFSFSLPSTTLYL